jgi:hypothetical protein
VSDADVADHAEIFVGTAKAAQVGHSRRPRAELAISRDRERRRIAGRRRVESCAVEVAVERAASTSTVCAVPFATMVKDICILLPCRLTACRSR